MNTFKLRAEIVTDVIQFLCKIQPIEFLDLESGNTPDVIFSFKTDMKRGELLEVIRGIEDGHVMLQTLELEADFTGERNYGQE